MFTPNGDTPYQELSAGNYKLRFADNGAAHVLLDVRSEMEYAHGRIPGAVNIPINIVPLRLDDIPADTPVVVVSAHGVRSVMVAEFLAAQGYRNIYNLTEGTAYWIERGFPVER